MARRSTSTASTRPTLVPPQHASIVLVCAATQRGRDPEGRRDSALNHPNFRWAVTREQLQQVRNNRLFGIFNGHPESTTWVAVACREWKRHGTQILSNGTLLYAGSRSTTRTLSEDPGNPNVAGTGTRVESFVRAARLEHFYFCGRSSAATSTRHGRRVGGLPGHGAPDHGQGQADSNT